MNSVPDQGDIVILDFNPQAGHEQAGKRPALVISPKIFNKINGFAWLSSITQQVKGYPFEIPLTGTSKTKGVVLVDQTKSLDWKYRNAHIVDKVDANCIVQVQVLIATILKLGNV